MINKPKNFHQLIVGISSNEFSFTRIERKIASFILSHPYFIANNTISNLAKKADVNLSAVIRFSKKFQFTGYTEFQNVFKETEISYYSDSESLDGIDKQSSIKNNDKSLDVDYWDSFIRELIPRGIARLFFFDGEKIATIAKHGDEGIEVKNSFETLLGLDIVYQLKSDLEINLGRTNQSQKDSSELENKFKKLEKELERLEVIKAGYVIELDEKTDDMNDGYKKIEGFEQEITKLGGNYAKQRTELVNNQTVLKGRLTIIEEEMRAVCADALPFSLIPKQVEQLVQTIKSDQDVLKNQFEKQILSENLDELKNKLNSDTFWNEFEINSKAKTGVVSKIEEFFVEKMSDGSNNQESVIGFSQKDSDKILDVLDRIHDVLPKKMEVFSKDFNQITEKLQKIQTSLSNAPAVVPTTPIVESKVA